MSGTIIGISCNQSKNLDNTFSPSVSTIILLFHTILPNGIGSFTWNSRTAFVLFVCLFSYIEFLSTKWCLAIHKNIQSTKIILYQSPEFLSLHPLAKCTFLRDSLTGMNVEHQSLNLTLRFLKAVSPWTVLYELCLIFSTLLPQVSIAENDMKNTQLLSLSRWISLAWYFK